MNSTYWKTYTIVGYAYEADLHCGDCTRKRFPLIGVRWHRDTDREGNPVTPYTVDECTADDYCGDCFQPLMEG